MTRARRLLLVFAALALVVAAAALADGQPAAAPQAQIVHFITHFVLFTPKDPTILGDGSDPTKEFPLIDRPFNDPHVHLETGTPRGLRRLKSLQELEPDLGPFDGLSSTKAEDVEGVLDRIDNRWNYRILTLVRSGPVGNMLIAYGHLSGLPLKTPDGIEVGRFDKLTFGVYEVLRVERLVGNGSAVLQDAEIVEETPGMVAFPSGVVPSETTLGVCSLDGAVSAGVRPYRSPLGFKASQVLLPGYLIIRTVGLGEVKAES